MSEHPVPTFRARLRGHRLALAAAGLLVVGGAAGAVTVAATRPSVSMAPVTPVAIRALRSTGGLSTGFGSDSIVTIRGRVAEIYGNQFVMADPTGRALVDLGPGGADGALVVIGQPVTVQGRFDRGIVHAAFLVGAGGKVTALGPLGGPPKGPHGPGPHGPGPRGPGPDGPGPDGPGAPPPAGTVPPPPPVPGSTAVPAPAAQPANGAASPAQPVRGT